MLKGESLGVGVLFIVAFVCVFFLARIGWFRFQQPWHARKVDAVVGRAALLVQVPTLDVTIATGSLCMLACLCQICTLFSVTCTI